MATNPGALPPAKKSKALLYVLLALGGFVVLILIAVVGLGLFVAHKAKQAGLDGDLIRRNPAEAAARMMVAANPDLEFVSADDGRQEIIVRDKKTGKVVTMSFNDAKNGKLVVKSDEGTFRVGGDAKVPAWVPDYPGSQPQGAYSAQEKGEEAGSFTFKTKDAGDKVIKYYQNQFQASGMKVTTNLTSQNGQSGGGMLVAEDDSRKHTITVILGGEGSETSVAVTYATSK
jgi:hypothetical protein